MTDRRTRRRAGRAAAALLALALAVWAVKSRRSAPAPDARRDAPARTATEAVWVGRGLVEALNMAPVELGAGGEIVAMAANGSAVQTGDLLVRVNDAAYLDRLAELELNLQAEQAEFAVRVQRRAFSRAEFADNLTLTSNRLALAELELSRTERGLSAPQRRLLEIQRDLRQLDLEEAAEALQRTVSLAESGFASEAAVESARRRVATTRAASEEAVTQLRLRTAPPRVEEQLERVQTVARLRGELARAVHAMERRLARADADLAVSQTQSDLIRFDLQAVSNDLARCAVYATTTGVFRVRMFQDWRTGGIWQPYKPGVERQRFDRIADLVQPGRMQVLLMLHEADIDRVRTGLPVRVEVPALRDRSFEGVLAELGGVGRDRYDVAPRGHEESPSGVVTYNGTVALRTSSPELRPGMSARVSIILPPAAEAPRSETNAPAAGGVP